VPKKVSVEFGRDIIAARVKVGLARAKAEDKKLGRCPVSADKEAAVGACLGQALG